MYKISKEFSVEYAHRLNLPYESTCTNLHGHSAKIIVSLWSSNSDILDANDMIIDFAKLKDLQLLIEKQLDHTLILNKNDSFVDLLNTKTKLYLIDGEPTAENLSKHICNCVENYLKVFGLPLSKISVTFYETAKNSASYEVLIEDQNKE